ncbi:NAD-dependent succinate-semialdehyde dehydrogenase [Marinobacterium sedimentorum]|uniref:NAD-dependent succinate-semialdehyde dehydrogenase n=1 Tax=Marinobacterium sedimentorum TaxID=2927804 RepID=UPI0020C6BF35|nr:NAD-dependent succinate-semialdehyde dehydrogenase [Marinobacterium sedimentorum]MCP8688456.1 NAD-dependent succinate-semialdehyde dehydrogenase [Marinobacterium sedimentorum]
MMFESRNPATAELIEVFDLLSGAQLETRLGKAQAASLAWRATDNDQRGALLCRIAAVLRAQRESLARTISLEMGKLLPEALAEVDKCAQCCEHYAEHAAAMLQDELIPTHARRSLVSFEPLGTILAVMPWNFPLWQVFRFLAPTLMAGNTALLKHAPNVSRCALLVEDIVREAGAPEGLFSTLLISVEQTAAVIADDRVQGVAFTGSEATGRKIAAMAGQSLKKVVLELGGSDPFIVLEDADLERAVEFAMKLRFGNAGQICIAAKRFILTPRIADEFVERLLARVAQLQTGDPLQAGTTLAPMAREDLRSGLQRQVDAALAGGARLLAGGAVQDGPGWFYQPSVLDNVKPGNMAFDEELFGPVASIVRAADAEDAIRLANATRFGLGASIWTADNERGEAIARRLEAGACFVNAPVASDVRMPFGGTKASGLGRELASYGIREFCNIKSLWIAD